MTNRDEILNTARQYADVARVAADTYYRRAATRLRVCRINADISRIYIEIGRAVYIAHTGGGISEADIDAALTLLDAKFDQLDAANEVLNSKRACPHCGKAV